MKKKMLILVYCLAMTLLISCVPTSNASNTVGVYNEIEIIENTNETINEIEEVIPDEKDIVEFEEPTVVETEEELIEETEIETEEEEEEAVAEEKTKETEETIKEEEQEEIKEEEIPVAPIVTPTPSTTPEPTPIPTETHKPEVEVIEEDEVDKKEVETPTSNITIIEDVDLSQDLKDLWKQYPENHFNQKTDSYIYYQSRDNFVKIHIIKSMDGSYMISASQTNGAKDMNASQFEIIKRVLEATVENSEELYRKFVEGYNGWYLHGNDSLEAVYKSLQWRDANTSFSDGVEKWKTLGNIEYKFELGGGVKMDYRAK